MIGKDYGKDGEAIAFVEMDVRNIGGAPTIADNYVVKILCPGGLNANGSLEEFPSKDFLQQIAMSGNYPLNLFEAGSMYINTSRPIGAGSHAIGWLFAKFPGLETNKQLTMSGCSWTVSFQDIHGKRYEAVKILSGEESKTPAYYPPVN
jgi:hypothetical protein